jgi:hypothetical protein
VSKPNTNAVRIQALETNLAQMGQALTGLTSMLETLVRGTQPQPQTVTLMQPQAVAQPQPVAKPQRQPAPPLPNRAGAPQAITAPQAVTQPAGPAWAQPGWAAPAETRTVAQAHADHETCFLGCRAARGQESKPSLGLIDNASGEYFPTGEGKMGALTAHAANGTSWQAVMVETGQPCTVSAAAIVQELARLRSSDAKGNRGVPSILTGESAISGARLTPAPFRRATMGEKLALDERAFRAASAVLAEAQALRAKMGRK